jgi:hypothetical protein
MEAAFMAVRSDHLFVARLHEVPAGALALLPISKED